MLSVLRAYPSSFRAFMQTGANGARLHPADRHWYLETMGVARGAQRQGLGGRLLEPVLEIADRDQVDCYLETADPRNAVYYARHGFVVENPALQLVSDGPAHITMRRRPTAAPGARPTATSTKGNNQWKRRHRSSEGDANAVRVGRRGGRNPAADGLLLRPRRA